MGESYFIFTVMLQIDEKKLVSLLKDFNKLTGIKICVLDEDGVEIACVPTEYCQFCKYIRSSPSGEEMCRLSDRRAFEICKRSGKPYRYVCHMGLTECVAPILQQGNCIGYLMIGQTAGERVRSGLFEERAEEYSLDHRVMRELYGSVVMSDDEKISAAVSIMEACAGYLYFNKFVHGAESVGGRIDRYIVSNLTADLSVEALCREFDLSRVALYSYVNRAFNTTPAEYVKK